MLLPYPWGDIVGSLREQGDIRAQADCSNVPILLRTGMQRSAWVHVQENEVFPVKLAIAIEDSRDSCDIASAISDLKTNIRQSRSSADEPMAQLR